MKHLGVLLASGLTLLIILMIGIFSFLPPQSAGSQVTAAETVVTVPTSQPVILPAALDMSQVEANLAQREAIYQGQITQLDQALQTRQTSYQLQIQTLSSQVETLQNQLNDLQTQEQNLLAQLAELETGRAERLAIYQTQLEQARNQYNQRYAEMQAQLNEAQTRLAEVNAQLGQ